LFGYTSPVPTRLKGASSSGAHGGVGVRIQPRFTDDEHEKRGGVHSLMPDQKKYSVVLAEDHTLFREGLKALLATGADFEVVAEAADGQEAIEHTEKLKPDLVLLDLTMPRVDGFTAIKEIKRRSLGTRILVLTVHKTEEHVAQTLDAGANGYVLKDASHNELILAMKSVVKDECYLSPAVSARVVDGYLNERKSKSPRLASELLTSRERQVLKLIAEGFKSKGIADVLCISEKTVAKHRANIMAKLDLHSASALTAFAIERGLVQR
jgi:two-component system response regulator NreC